MAGKTSAAMERAEKAVTSDKLTPQEAAVKYGLSVVSIYRKQWYKDWRKTKTDNK